MNSHLDRALLLFQQSRFDLAEQEVRRVLGEMPNDPGAHALLGMCLVHQEKLDEAQQEAEQAIALAPAWAYTHHCRSLVMEHRKQFAEAEKSAREAVRLDPLDADYWARLAAVLFRQEKWKDAYDAAMQGLEHDPENSGCTHLRTMTLTKLGRQAEAVASVDAALRRDPDDAMAHTNKGWALLHQDKPREALEQFREALRIDPMSDYAKAGIVEALKARNPIYRWILAYFLWMARLSNGARWGVVLGGYFGARVLRGFADSNPAWAPWIQPLIVVYIVFVLMTWFAYPLFNLLLRFNKFGWYALNRDQRAASNWFGACLAVFVGAAVVYFAWDVPGSLTTSLAAVGLALPLVTIYSCDVGWPRQAMTAFAGAMAVVGATMIVLTVLGHPSLDVPRMLFLLGFLATPWLANYLVSQVATR
jgi:tetratricopeptide (TPR) repeat protein